MNYFKDKIENLRLSFENLESFENKKESKFFLNIIDILDDMSNVLDDIIDNKYNLNKEDYEYAFICMKCSQEIEVEKNVLDSEEDIICPKCGNYIPIFNANFSDEDFL